jgi:hypothetical protein
LAAAGAITVKDIAPKKYQVRIKDGKVAEINEV